MSDDIGNPDLPPAFLFGIFSMWLAVEINRLGRSILGLAGL